jgi:hypothetical protein
MSLVAERVTLNPVREDPTLQMLDLVGMDPSWGIYLLGHDYPPPKPEIQRAASADTEGDPIIQSRYPNRIITMRLRLVEPADPAATNLVRNPSFELATTGWAFSEGGFTAASMVREALPAAFAATGSEYGLRLRGTKDNTATERFLIADTEAGVAGFAVAANTNYVYSAYVYAADAPNHGGGNNFILEVTWYTAAGAVISTSTQQALVNTGEVKRLTLAAKSPATAAFAKVRVVGWTTTALDTVDYWIDRIQLETGETATSYFDGESPGCEWSGVKAASTSSRAAPDGTRFSRMYGDVTGILDRLKREKYGYLSRKAPGFASQMYDLTTVEVTDAPQDISLGMKRAEIALQFEADPGGRGPEVQIGGNFDELEKPCLRFLAEAVPGDMPALGRMLVTNLEGKAQQDAWWGLRQRFYSSNANADLFYEAESRTPLGGFALAAGPAGASGAGNNTLKGRVRPAWMAIMSTQAAGGGAHLQHVGSYRVLVRIQRPLGNSASETGIKLQWAVGDFAHPVTNENDAVWFTRADRQGAWTIEDLGVVTIDQPPSGTTPRWEGRVLTTWQGTGGQLDEMYIDWMMLIPTDEGAGEAHTSTSIPAPTSMKGMLITPSTGALTTQNDEMGAFTFKALTNSDPDDFQGNGTEGYITRTTVSDSGTLVIGPGRAVGWEPLTLANVAFAMKFKLEKGSTGIHPGILLRVKDNKNFVFLEISTDGNATSTYYDLWVVQEGVKTRVGSKTDTNKSPKEWQRVILICIGEIMKVVAGPVGSERLLISASHEALGAGKALEKGGGYIYDEWSAAGAFTRYYDDIEIWEPPFDAVMYPGRTLEIFSDRIRRQDAAGEAFGRPPYEGDYLLVPHAGPEKRVSQFIVKGSRDRRYDAGIDDIRAQLFVTPRYLEAPPT